MALDSNEIPPYSKKGKVLHDHETRLTALETAGNVGTADLANGAVTKAKAAVFQSTEQTGTGSSQDIAHGLGVIPSVVIIEVSEHPGTPDTGAFDVAKGAHDATNVKVTVTTGVKFFVFAWA